MKNEGEDLPRKNLITRQRIRLEMSQRSIIAAKTHQKERRKRKQENRIAEGGGGGR